MELEPGRRRPYWFLLVLVAGGFFAVCIFLWSTSFGIGVEPDSAVYISTARSVVSGDGFQAQGKPLTHFPPGYSALLSVSGLWNADPADGARYIHAVLYVLNVWLIGLYGESIYLKDLLDKIGVQADILQVGEYKSAGEPLTRTGPSEEAENNINWLFDELFDAIVEMIAEARELKPDEVERLLDGGPYLARWRLRLNVAPEEIAAVVRT